MVKKKRGKEIDCKPKFFSLQIVAIVLFILLLVSLNSASVGNNVPHEKTITGHATWKENWDAMWKNWGEGQLDIVIARYLFFCLGIILLFSLGKMVFPKMNPIFHFLIAIILAFLFTGFILPGELLAVMAAYDAAGLALIAVIPFFILLVFTGTMLAKAQIGPAQAVLERFVWLFFFIFLLYKAVTGFSSGSVTADSFVLWILVGIALLSFGIFWWHTGYLKLIANTLAAAFGTVGGYTAAAFRTRMSKNVKRIQAQHDEQVAALQKELAQARGQEAIAGVPLVKEGGVDLPGFGRV
jgi:hypothetical protein